jgi:beta-lactamase regulating signal transducer with metallopeptidase domain
MTIGLLAPAVILPPDWSDWDPAELSAVLAHEEEHARRRDTLVAAIALVNRAIFWFHPLAWCCSGRSAGSRSRHATPS